MRPFHIHSTSIRCPLCVPVGVALVDGLHTYDGVRDDIDAWAPKVAPGGVMMFNDVMAPWFFLPPAFPG
eukprot:gene11660-8818_t